MGLDEFNYISGEEDIVGGQNSPYFVPFIWKGSNFHIDCNTRIIAYTIT